MTTIWADMCNHFTESCKLHAVFDYEYFVVNPSFFVSIYLCFCKLFGVFQAPPNFVSQFENNYLSVKDPIYKILLIQQKLNIFCLTTYKKNQNIDANI